MIERRKRAENTANLLQAWTAIGWFTRLIFTFAIIACFLWSVKTIFEVVLWLRVLLG